MSDEMTSGDDPGVYEIEGEVLGIDPVGPPPDPAPTTGVPGRWRPPGLAAFPAERPVVGNVDVFKALLADARSKDTERARYFDMLTLGQYLGMASPGDATATLVGGTEHQANAIGLGFRRHMQDLGLASGTINRRICTIRRAVKLARRLGVVGWTIDVESVPQQTYRDTSGPGDDGWRKMLAVATGQANAGSAKGARDLAVLRLLHNNGLRCGEVAGLVLSDVDLGRKKVAIIGKGRRSREGVTINEATARAIGEWLAHRGQDAGPLFVRMSKVNAAGEWSGKATNGLDRRSIYQIVASVGEAAGVEKGCHPHGLRHVGATRLLEKTGGDIRAVQN